MIRNLGISISLLCLSISGCSRGEEPEQISSPIDESTPVAATDNGTTQTQQPDEPNTATNGDANRASVEVVEEPVYNADRPNEPLNERTRAVIWNVPEDNPPEVLNATRADLEGRHYLYCDELHVAHYYERLKDIGGAYLGVGSDQAYTFIGWMKADVAWLTDYDPWIKQLHRIYHAFFEDSETVDAFIERWHNDNHEASKAWLEAKFEGDPELERILLVFHSAQAKVLRRIYRLRRMAERYEIPTFVSDDETYEFVRDAVVGGRVRPMLGNLLADRALQGIGDASRELGVPVRAIYVSNAENYWDYSDQYRENMKNLNFGETAWVLRTAASKSRNGDYRYNMQDARNYVEWLEQDYVEDRRDIWVAPGVRNENDVPFEVLDEPPFDR